MESHHDDDETKGSVYLFVQDYIEAREASGSVRTAGPKDLTVTFNPSPACQCTGKLHQSEHFLDPGPAISVRDTCGPCDITAELIPGLLNSNL